MGSNRSYSYFWDITLRKFFPKRRSLSRTTTTGSRSQSSWGGLESSPTDEHADGFYKYSQEVLEQEKRDGFRLRSSDSTAGSYASALMGPSDRPPLPYTVSAPDWNIFSSYVKYLDELEDDSVCEWLGSVLSVWTSVYAVSKVAVMAFMHYGVELDSTPDGILAHMKRAEDLVASNSIIELIDNTESLYYALYARLIMEIAAADLCASFSLEVRRLATNSAFILPEPSQLCKILFMCKQALDGSTICVNLNKELVRQHQLDYIRRTADRVQDAGFVLDDLIGYRQHAIKIVSDKSSDFCQKWDQATVLYVMPPGNVLALQSEKYLSLSPRSAVQQVVPVLRLPFIEPDTIPPAIRERDIIMDNRQATLAKLEGKCIGEARRTEGRRRLIDLVRERKCICRSVCICAHDCTQDVERHCPCSERLLSLMVAKRRNSVGPLPFGPRCSALAKAIFHGIASIRPDTDDMELTTEIDRATMIFVEEVQKQRSADVFPRGAGI